MSIQDVAARTKRRWKEQAVHAYYTQIDAFLDIATERPNDLVELESRAVIIRILRKLVHDVDITLRERVLKEWVKVQDK